MNKEELPLILSGSHADREARARTLVTLFVKFLSDHVDLLVQVRQDFLIKPAAETIMGCKTFGEYCRNILHYSESHIRRLIAGKNPATKIFDGSKNRALPLKSGEGGEAVEKVAAITGESADTVRKRAPEIPSQVGCSIQTTPLQSLSETFYVIRRKSDGKFLSNEGWKKWSPFVPEPGEVGGWDGVQYFGPGDISGGSGDDSRMAQYDSGKKTVVVPRNEWEWVRVEASYKLTAEAAPQAEAKEEAA